MKVGGRYALAGGAIVVDKIHETRLDDITAALARRCGFASLVDLLKTAKHGAGERVFVIDFHYDGKASARPEARRPARSRQRSSRSSCSGSKRWTGARRSAHGRWRRCARSKRAPAVLAAKLARSLGRPRDEFKRDVRKLKNLGLTFSLEIGYRLTPKGEALLARE